MNREEQIKAKLEIYNKRYQWYVEEMQDDLEDRLQDDFVDAYAAKDVSQCRYILSLISDRYIELTGESVE